MNNLPDGVYFRMPEEQYLSIPRLSKSAIKKLRVSPADFWHESWLNPHKPELTPDQEARKHKARVIGRAYHCARLEPDRFAAEYVREPSKAEAPDGTLFTLDEMKDVIRDLNSTREKPDQLKLGGSAMEVAERLAADGYSRSELWHLVLADWEASLPEGAVRLDGTTFDEIAEDGRRLRMVEDVTDLLTGGCAEVTILYTCPDTGIPMKSRIDYLRPEDWVELKTFSNPNGKHLMQCVMDAIRFNRYYLDAACYMEAITAIRDQGLAVRAEGEAPTRDEARLFHTLYAFTGTPDCHFIFQQTGGVPNVLARKWRFFEPDGSAKAIAEMEALGVGEEQLQSARDFQRIAGTEPRPTAIHTKARIEIKRAKEDFLAYSEIYPAGDPWLPFNPSGEITDADFHPNWLEEIS